MSHRDDILQALRHAGLMDDDAAPSITALAGGVSGDVYRVDLDGQSICVKQPLERLRVAAEWHAPVERAHSEVAWLRFAAGVDARIVPEILAEDREHHLFAMRFLPPEQYPVWKARLMEGIADADFARAVGAALVRIHAASAGQADIESRFANQDLFFALRVEPYLLHTARAHPAHAAQLQALGDSLDEARIALMHGDVSPKNILCGPDGPVFLDAETACYGDPAFDLAFCLNHLLLKSVYRPASAAAFGTSFAALRAAYFAGVDWEDKAALDIRVARLLAALLLARVDGKSPAEYIQSVADKDFVRRAALSYMDTADLTLESLSRDWQERFQR